MPIAIKMPALSPTMEEGTLARWLVKVGDKVSSGDIMAEIETDKATMEFEAVDEGTIAAIDVPEGTAGVKVGTVIAMLAGEDEDGASSGEQAKATPAPASAPASAPAAQPKPTGNGAAASTPVPASASRGSNGRVIASPLARRIAGEMGVDLAQVKGSGPNGRIVKSDVEAAQPGTAKAAPLDQPAAAASAPAPASAAKPATPAPAAATPGAAKLTDAIPDFGIPFEDQKLSGMRKTIARRLTESKQQVPHIYLTVDVRLDALLKLRGELNAALAARGVKLSVNDLLIKALGVALIQVPKCNVAFAGDVLRQYTRADISVAVSVPNGLITPIVTDAAGKGVAQIATEMGTLAAKAREGKLQPNEYQGGTASLSNMGMMRIKQFDAVINPPQGMILAVGAGEKRPFVVEDALAIATVMSATGSFDHRAIDGADGAQLMSAFKDLVEMPLGLLA